MNTCILGVDPGVSGALAFYFPYTRDRVIAEDVPTAGGNIDGANLYARLREFRPDLAVIELVNAMPGQGVSSTFKFGRAFGTLVGCIQAAGIQLHFVTPAKWKRHFSLPAEKERARELALRMFAQTPAPFARKKDHGRAEAALLALYAAEALVNRGTMQSTEAKGEKVGT
jgi:Holliday junction resolvasome RuvABC endonuclease subunit